MSDNRVKMFYNNYDYLARAPYFIEYEKLTDEQKFLLTESKTFCMLPWVHMHAYPDGRAFPCCMADYWHPVGDLRKNTMAEVWNQEPYTELRMNMIAEVACKECTKCYEQEQAGFFSMRYDANRNYGHHIAEVDKTQQGGKLPDFKIRYWDVRFSNLCNFKCRSCGPIFSSNWYQDHVARFGKKPDVLGREMAVVEYTGRTKTDIQEQMLEHIPYLEQVYFAGGEPLLMEEHYVLLEELIKHGKTDVRLQYNTNFSVLQFKDKHVFEYWKHFKNVSVGASLDASGARAELMRKGTDWEQTVANRQAMIKEVPHVDFYIGATISAMNVLHILDFHKEWVELGLIKPKDFNVNICQSPAWYRVDIFPAWFKQEVLLPKYKEHIAWLDPQDPLRRATNGFESAINIITGTEASNQWNTFVEEINKLDSLRNENFWNTFTEFKVLQDCKVSSNLCMLPWISVETTPLGNTRPCCLAKDFITDENNVPYNLKDTSLKEIYESKYMQNMRKSFRNGEKPATCQRCWDEEAAGRTSKRLATYERLPELERMINYAADRPNTLWFLDLKLGNICNLKCRICGSWSSSKWAQEEMDYVESYMDPKDHTAYQWLKDGKWPRESTIFWDSLKEILKSVHYIEFTGGEPLMIPEHFELLQFAIDSSYANQIELHYNTNGTQYPEKYAHLWKEFKAVEIAFSIDNIGPRYEYERYLANWDEVKENVNKFQTLRNNSSNITTQVCMTINILNVYYLEELCKWVDTQRFDYCHFNMLHDPRHFNIGHMTNEAKEIVIDKLTNGSFSTEHRVEIDKLIQFIKNGSSSDGEKFRDFVKKTDTYRNQSLLTTHPEIAEAMGYE